MLRFMALFVSMAVMLDHAAAIYVRIQALNANGGRRGGGERVFAHTSGCCIHLSPYKANDDTQVWEKIDVPDTIKFYLHQKGLTQRVTMSDSKQGNQYDLWMMDPKAGDDRQTFIKKNKKIYCNAGNRLSDGREYVLMFDESANRVRCGPKHETPQEDLEFVSTKEVDLNKNQFFIVNKAHPHAKAYQHGIWFLWKTDGFDARKIFEIERGTGQYHNSYIIKTVMHTDYGNILVGGDHKIHTWPHRSIQDYWTIERVVDNLGDDWDYYRIVSVRVPDMPMIFAGTDNPYLLYWPGTHWGDKALWRLIPRYRGRLCANHEAQRVSDSTKQPTDVKETVKYTKGLKLTKSNSISTKTGISVALQRSITNGAISSSVTATLSFEFSTVNTWSSESTWSREVTTERTFPANQDCRLYQRKVQYISAIGTDNLSQTPGDFKMVCVKQK